jgi:hypothetical protein
MIIVQLLRIASNDDNTMTLPSPDRFFTRRHAAYSTFSSIRYLAQSSLRMTSARKCAAQLPYPVREICHPMHFASGEGRLIAPSKPAHALSVQG